MPPAGIIRRLELKQPGYTKTAAYGHFGRNGFTWEKLDYVDRLSDSIREYVCRRWKPFPACGVTGGRALSDRVAGGPADSHIPLFFLNTRLKLTKNIFPANVQHLTNGPENPHPTAK